MTEPSPKNKRRAQIAKLISTICAWAAGLPLVAFILELWIYGTKNTPDVRLIQYPAIAGCLWLLYYGFRRLWLYFAQVEIPDFIRLTAMIDPNGLPSVVWEAQEGNRKAEMDLGVQIIYNEFMRVRWHAFCSADGFLTVTAQNFFHHLVFDDEKRKPGYLPLGEAPLNIRVRVPIDEVVGFSKRDSAHVELGGLDLVRFQKGTLLYMNHNIAVVEMRDKSSFLFGYSCYSAQDTDHLIVALTQEFIMKRPPGGWVAMLKKKADAENNIPAVVTASATHDPI